MGRNIVNLAIGFVLAVVTLTNFIHSPYNREGGVIEWDIKSYYAYLPALFIYNDLSLDFRRENIEKFGDLIWPVETPAGRQAIITTMGMSVLYSPFFFAGHLTALLTRWEADGYSRPYRFALAFSALFYLWGGMIFLKKILRTWFGDHIVAFTILTVTLGTNLYYYATYEAPMSHAFNFTLIAAFLWLTIRFYSRPSVWLIAGGGLLAGLITLVRPVNIIVLVLFFLWDAGTLSGLRQRTAFFAGRPHWVMLMAASFILVWIPQFIYWHWVSGEVFYFSYGEAGGRFFFNNPQIINILFSFKKGWLIYTPVMIFAIAGIFSLSRKRKEMVAAISVFLVLNIYILSSWWNWWYGGGFGLRSFTDSYAVMAIPFAAFIEAGWARRKLLSRAVTIIIALLILYNQFQTRQYVNNAIHWWWMNREAYAETFLRLRPTERYWQLIAIPDHDLARQGIYRELPREPVESSPKGLWKKSPTDEELAEWLAVRLMNDGETPGQLTGEGREVADTLELLRNEAARRISEHGRARYEKERAVSLIIEEILGSSEMTGYIRKKAVERDIPFDTMLVMDATWIFENQRK